MHAQHVAEVLVVRADLEHLEGLLVVACATSLRMCQRLIRHSATFIATIGQIRAPR